MAFRKSYSAYVSGTSHNDFVPVRIVELKLSKIYTLKKKYPYLFKVQFLIDWDHF